MKKHVQGTLEGIGEDPSREGLLKTPERVSKAMLFLTQGYEQDAGAILRSALFEETYDEMIVVKDTMKVSHIRSPTTSETGRLYSNE